MGTSRRDVTSDVQCVHFLIYGIPMNILIFSNTEGGGIFLDLLSPPFLLCLPLSSNRDSSLHAPAIFGYGVSK